MSEPFPCPHPSWRANAKTSWSEENEIPGWTVQRQYQNERCTNCDEMRYSRSLPKRRRFRQIISATPFPEQLKQLTASRWNTLEVLILRLQSNRYEVLDILVEWAEQGWIEVEEKQVEQAAHWQIDRVRLSPLLVEQRAGEQDQSKLIQKASLFSRLSALLEGWREELMRAFTNYTHEDDILLLLQRFERIFREQEESILTQTIIAPTGTTIRAGGERHLRMIALLRGILELLAFPRTEHERIFSAKWLQDSKAMQNERRDLETFLDLEGGLARLGLVKHTPTVLSRGNWQAMYGTFQLDGRAGSSFVATPADTIAQLQDMQVHADRLVIIENRTPFEFFVQADKRELRTMYLDGAGFPGFAERQMVALWLRATPLPWFIWTDFDFGGASIQKFWDEWAIREHLPPPRPYRWQYQDLQSCQSIGIQLSEETRVKLLQLNHPLAQLLYEWGYTAEQEAILHIHPDWFR